LEAHAGVHRPLDGGRGFGSLAVRLAYYLDTTAHLERHGGEQQVRDEIESRLGTEQHATSTHVEREWKRIVHGAAADILNAIKDAGSLQDVRAKLRQCYGRVATQRWLVYDMLVEDQHCSIEELERRARRALRTTFTAIFTDRVTVRDGSRCGIAPRAVIEDDNGWRFPGTCQKTESICDQVSFLRARPEQVFDAANALLNSPRDNDKKMGHHTIQRMELADSELKGQNCYGSNGVGGDISIALECGADETLLTTDHSFDLICPAIGAQHQRINATRMPSVGGPAKTGGRSRSRRRGPE